MNKSLKMLKTMCVMSLLLLIAIPLVVSSAAAEQNVCRDLPTEANPGDIITVSLDVTIDGGDRIIIDEVYPAGWTIVNAGTGDTTEAGHIKWVQIGGAVSDTILTYQVQVPGTASGIFTFSGEYKLSADPTQCIDCDTQVNIVDNGEPVTSDQNVCRDLPAEANPGELITVSLDVTIDGGDRIIIDEVYPAGWTIVNVGTGDTTEAGHIKWVETGAVSDKILTYQVQVPGTASGIYTFSGEYNLGSGTQDVDCDTQVNVVDDGGPVTSDQNVCRDLPAEGNPDEVITVSLEVTIDGGDRIIIDEVYPAGWTIVNAETGDTTEAGHIKWVETGAVSDKILTYQVQVPGTASGIYTFSGEYDLGSGTKDIDCDTQVNVVEIPVIPDEGICLTEGWNFVSIPYTLAPDNKCFIEVLEGLPVVDCVMYYDAYECKWDCTGGEWLPLKGYWMHATEDCCIPAEKLVRKQTNNIPPTLKLYPGWNAVGSPEESTQYANCAFVTVDCYLKVVGPWACEDGNWNYQFIGYNNGFSEPCNDETHMTVDLFPVYPYKGYWMYVTDDCCVLA